MLIRAPDTATSHLGSRGPNGLTGLDLIHVSGPTYDLAHPTTGRMTASLPLPARIAPLDRPLGLIGLLRTVLRNPIEAWPAEIFREPFHRSRRFGQETVYVTAPELIEEILITQADAFGKGEMTRRALAPALGDTILTADGARWRWQRRAAAPIFRHDRIAGFAPAMLAAAERTRARWSEHGTGAELDIAHEMMRTTFDIIVETMLSGHANIDAGLVERAMTDYLDSVPWVIALAMLRAPAWMPFPGRRRAHSGQSYLKTVLGRLVKDARARPQSSNDLLSLLISAIDPETGAAMDDADVRDNLLTFVAAGHETTAQALTWTIYLLSLHPEIERQVVVEIARVTAGAPLTHAHVEALVLTRTVLMEGLRLYPPAALVVRTAERQVRVGNETITPGTNVYVPIYAVHRHEALWQDPDRFDPRRFATATSKSRHRCAYLPFGAGPRTCIGMNFALTEAVLILATLLPAFRLRLRPGYVPKPSLRITLRPATGMPMRITHLAG